MNERKKLMNVREAAEYLAIQPNTLRIWKCTGRYSIPYVRVGRLIKYYQADLDAFLERRRVEPIEVAQ